MTDGEISEKDKNNCKSFLKEIRNVYEFLFFAVGFGKKY